MKMKASRNRDLELVVRAENKESYLFYSRDLASGD